MCDATEQYLTGIQRSLQELRARSLETQCDCKPRQEHSPLQAFTKHNCTQFRGELHKIGTLSQIKMKFIQNAKSHFTNALQAAGAENSKPDCGGEENNPISLNIAAAGTSREAKPHSTNATALHRWRRNATLSAMTFLKMLQNRNCIPTQHLRTPAPNSPPSVRSTPAHPCAGTARRA